ncbi:MAG: hypothetical protein EPN40_09375 [Rhodanobacteraceae bacterium]|nr:MAG: hypothetical protein EPN40_09375 [Rhodanobacteraceae bacterium]
MKRTILAIAVAASMGAVTAVALAGGQQAQTEPTATEIHQRALQDGPATPQLDYLTHEDPVTPHHDAAAADPKPVPQLTRREAGMLYSACIAYPECVTAYSKAYEHEQALLRAQKAKASGGSGH